MFHSFALRSHQPDRLLRIVDFIGQRIVAVPSKPVPQDDRRDAEIVEVRDEVRPFGADVERVVARRRAPG